MSQFLRTLPLWPTGQPLPAGAITLFYDPATDQEYQIDPARLGGSGGGGGGGTGTVKSVNGLMPDPATGDVALPVVDIFNVPAAKAQQVISDYAGNGGPLTETASQYFGQQFIDDYSSAGDEFLYICAPSRPSSSSPATVWKWRRYLETGA